MIRIERPSRWVDSMLSYNVMLDGREAGRIGSGETLELDAAPGPHERRRTIDWCSSPTIAFEVLSTEAAEPIAFEYTPAIAGWRAALQVLSITVLRGRYIWLERVG